MLIKVSGIRYFSFNKCDNLISIILVPTGDVTKQGYEHILTWPTYTKFSKTSKNFCMFPGGTHISPVTRLLTPIELGSLMTEPQSERPFPIIGVSLDTKGVVIPVSISKSKITVCISTEI